MTLQITLSLLYLVGQRRHEIGARVALGALPGDIFRLALKEGVVSTLIGIALGVADRQTTRLSGINLRPPRKFMYDMRDVFSIFDLYSGSTATRRKTERPGARPHFHTAGIFSDLCASFRDCY